MMRTSIALFHHVDTMLTAERRLREYGVEDITILSPVPIRRKGIYMTMKKDPVRFFALFGGLAGALSGALFALGASITYPLPRGGRAIAAIPPVMIISFETLILLGVLATFAGFLIIGRFPALKDRHYHDSIGIDRFGLLIKAEPERMDTIEAILREGEAEEVVRVGE